MEYFSYGVINQEGVSSRALLPFDPYKAGYRLHEDKSCCLLFRKGDYQLRVNKGEGMIEVINWVTEEKYHDTMGWPQNHKRFIELLNKGPDAII